MPGPHLLQPAGSARCRCMGTGTLGRPDQPTWSRGRRGLLLAELEAESLSDPFGQRRGGRWRLWDYEYRMRTTRPTTATMSRYSDQSSSAIPVSRPLKMACWWTSVSGRRQEGYAIPVACTSALWHGWIVPPEKARSMGQCERGRVHDLLFVLITDHPSLSQGHGSASLRVVLFQQSPGRTETVRFEGHLRPRRQGRAGSDRAPAIGRLAAAVPVLGTATTTNNNAWGSGTVPGQSAPCATPGKVLALCTLRHVPRSSPWANIVAIRVST